MVQRPDRRARGAGRRARRRPRPGSLAPREPPERPGAYIPVMHPRGGPRRLAPRRRALVVRSRLAPCAAVPADAAATIALRPAPTATLGAAAPTAIRPTSRRRSQLGPRRRPSSRSRRARRAARDRPRPTTAPGACSSPPRTAGSGSVDADGRSPAEPMVDLERPHSAAAASRACSASRSTPTSRPTRGSSSTTPTRTATRSSPASRSTRTTPTGSTRDSHRQLLFIEQPYRATTTAAASRSGRTATCTSPSATAAAAATRTATASGSDTLLGKILRIDVDADGDAGYGIPPDNPFADGDGMRRDLALRPAQPVALLVRSRDGRPVDRRRRARARGRRSTSRAAGEGGLNFGWNIDGGRALLPARRAARPDGLTLPVTEYGRDARLHGHRRLRLPRRGLSRSSTARTSSPTTARGLIFAIDGGDRHARGAGEVGDGDGSISAFGEDANGELYVLSLDGTISRVTATRAARRQAPGLSAVAAGRPSRVDAELLDAPSRRPPA